MLKPFIDPLRDHHTAWLTVAMASTLAGNFTVLGSIANLIVVQRAAASGVDDRLLGLFQGRRAADPHHPRDRDAVAVAVTSAEGKAFQPALARRHQLPARRCARRARALSECVPGHPAALEPVRSRIW